MKKIVLLLILTISFIGCSTNTKDNITLYNEASKTGKVTISDNIFGSETSKEDVNKGFRSNFCLSDTAVLNERINATLEAGIDTPIILRFTDETKNLLIQYNDSYDPTNLDEVEANKVTTLPSKNECIEAQVLYKETYKGKNALGVNNTWPVFEVVAYEKIDKAVAKMSVDTTTYNLNQKVDLGKNITLIINKAYVDNTDLVLNVTIDNQNNHKISGIGDYSQKILVNGVQLKNGSDTIYDTDSVYELAGKSKATQNYVFSGSDLLEKLKNASNKFTLKFEFYIDDDSYTTIDKSINITLK
ncbi:MAG: hypothetical protein LBR40_00770 [Bacilli bacterium]|jgi:hypothetical protein|nr:hypothetical protein [Bacilli bacterium]